MVSEFLASIGLQEKEIRLYILLQRLGTQPTSALARHVRLSRSTAYSALKRLEERGLVSETKNRGVQFFTALEATQLLQYVEDQMQQLVERKDQAKAVIAQMESLKNPLTQRPRVEVFSGVDGARLAMRKTLGCKSRTILAFTSLFDLTDRLGERFLKEYMRQRVKSRVKMKIIRTEEKYMQALKSQANPQTYASSKKELREVKCMPDDLGFSLGMYLFDDTIVIISSKDENFALVIVSPCVARLFRGMFTMLWKLLPAA